MANMSCRIPQSTREKLDRMAKSSGLTRSDIIRRLIDSAQLQPLDLRVDPQALATSVDKPLPGMAS
jgi:hypothetical protein